MPAIQLIIGLGNPGPEHEPTRHNAGFWFVDALARQCQVQFHAEKRFSGDVARCLLPGMDCRLLKPMTYMNRSGQSAGAMSRFYNIPVENILVVHDELDLPAGTVKLKKGGGHGGHNGLRDLISHFSSRDFWRLRLGIDHPGHKSQVVDYVLKRPSKQDRQLIEAAIDDALRLMPDIIAGDFEKVMQQLHSRS